MGSYEMKYSDSAEPAKMVLRLDKVVYSNEPPASPHPVETGL